MPLVLFFVLFFSNADNGFGPIPTWLKHYPDQVNTNQWIEVIFTQCSCIFSCGEEYHFNAMVNVTVI